MIDIDLSWPEIILAANAGMMRRINAVRNKRKESYGERPQFYWNNDINGAIAELALAKYRDVFWSGTVGRVDLTDVGPLQVRSKTDLSERLVIRPEDDDNQIFVSVFVGLPRCGLCGWLRGRDGKRPEWNLPHPQTGAIRYFVPNDMLEPMETLGKAEEFVA